MITLLAVLAIILCIIFWIIALWSNVFDEFCATAAIISLIAFFVFLIWDCVLIYQVNTAHTIDTKIAMYAEENTAIDQGMAVLVKQYMEYEANTFTELKDKDAINLVSLCPELKADTLVQQQLDTYVSNRKKIVTLKEKKINLSKKKWLLYFGK